MSWPYTCDLSYIMFIHVHKRPSSFHQHSFVPMTLSYNSLTLRLIKAFCLSDYIDIGSSISRTFSFPRVFLFQCRFSSCFPFLLTTSRRRSPSFLPPAEYFLRISYSSHPYSQKKKFPFRMYTLFSLFFFLSSFHNFSKPWALVDV